LVDGLKKLAKSDPLDLVTTEDTGEHIIAGCGELHVEICINDLKKEFCNIEIVESEPIVTYKETFQKPLTKSVWLNLPTNIIDFTLPPLL